MNISLPEKLKKKVAEIVEQGDFSTPSDYMRQLIRDDLEKKRTEDLRLKELLLEGLNSPISNRPPKEFFTELREKIKNNKL